MAKALGLGGVFFKSSNPQQLGAWYKQCLGMPVDEYGATFQPGDIPEGGFTAWSPFREDTGYFQPSARDYMFNLIVDDLEGCLAQVQDAGGTLVGGIDEHEYGRFGWFIDPEGNKVELWEPRKIGA